MTASDARSAMPSAPRQTAEHRQRVPVRFFLVTFAWSWLILLPLVLTEWNIIRLPREFVPKAMLPALIVAAFGPGVGALFSLRTLNGAGAIRQYLKAVPDLRLGWRVWAIPVLVSAGTISTAWILPELWGVAHVPLRLPPVSALPAFLVFIFFLSGSQEELGWRGYILDPLENRFGPWLGSLFLGVIWAIWHVPLFLIPGSGLDSTPFIAFVLMTTGYSWFFSWMRDASRKRTLSGIYGHGLINLFGSVVPTLDIQSGATVRYWIWAGLVFGTGIAAMVKRSSAKSPARSHGVARTAAASSR